MKFSTKLPTKTISAVATTMFGYFSIFNMTNDLWVIDFGSERQVMSNSADFIEVLRALEKNQNDL